jgi:S-disulfanyl-L-cysteine oxidoreductase SoxD
MRKKIILMSALAAWTAVAALSRAGDAQAQATSSVWDGVYTDAQANRGSALYVQHCLVCHGVTLGGNNEAPPLTGEFIPDWAGMSLADLFDKISVTMPLSAPGTLSHANTADILAFILKSNGFPGGSKELDSDGNALKTISFDVSKPQAAPSAKAKRARPQ